MYLSFVGTGTDDMQLKEGEQYFVLEMDTGDGWTKVKSKTGNMEGFVPTLYLQIL